MNERFRQRVQVRFQAATIRIHSLPPPIARLKLVLPATSFRSHASPPPEVPPSIVIRLTMERKKSTKNKKIKKKKEFSLIIICFFAQCLMFSVLLEFVYFNPFF